METSSYFAESNPPLEKMLEEHFDDLRTALHASRDLLNGLEAVVLGGGYGRGEGGVFTDADGKQHLFNDLDYFVFARDRTDQKIQRFFQAYERESSKEMGIDVEFTVLSLENLGDPSESMMFYDLLAGNKIVYGPEGYLESKRQGLDPARIHSDEATRLLWNRGSGLFFGRCRLAEREEISFIQRNHQKCLLALGDALLAMNGSYHWSCRERFRRLQDGLGGLTGMEILADYEKAVDFKLNPKLKALTWTELEEENEKLTDQWRRIFLEVESHRLDTRFSSLTDYYEFRGRLLPEVPRWKSPLLAARDWKKHGRSLRPINDYPRASLMRALAVLNDKPWSVRKSQILRRFLPANEPLPLERDWEPLYEEWWGRYS